jgi:hypothetical protein
VTAGRPRSSPTSPPRLASSVEDDFRIHAAVPPRETRWQAS